MSKRKAEDAKSWVEKAVAFYEDSGKRIAFGRIFEPRGTVCRGRKVHLCIESQGTMLAHGINEKFVGEDFSGVKDYDGRSFIKTIIRRARLKAAAG